LLLYVGRKAKKAKKIFFLEFNSTTLINNSIFELVLRAQCLISVVQFPAETDV
jgi:hypothetical protein